jgi:hypothetical protein
MVRDVDASLTNALVASEVRVRQHHELVVPGRDGVVGAVMFSLVAVACAAAAIVATATRPAGIALAFLFANLARRSWRAGVTVSGAQIEVRDGQHTSRVDFDDIVDVSTGTQGASIPPEVVLTTQSGHQVFVGGEGWWQRGQAKHYAKSAFEMSEADVRELAVLGRYRARFARE